MRSASPVCSVRIFLSDSLIGSGNLPCCRASDGPTPSVTTSGRWVWPGPLWWDQVPSQSGWPLFQISSHFPLASGLNLPNRKSTQMHIRISGRRVPADISSIIYWRNSTHYVLRRSTIDVAQRPMPITTMKVPLAITMSVTPNPRTARYR